MLDLVALEANTAPDLQERDPPLEDQPPDVTNRDVEHLGELVDIE